MLPFLPMDLSKQSIGVVDSFVDRACTGFANGRVEKINVRCQSSEKGYEKTKFGHVSPIHSKQQLDTPPTNL